jgi:hypothetical protein
MYNGGGVVYEHPGMDEEQRERLYDDVSAGRWGGMARDGDEEVLVHINGMGSVKKHSMRPGVV